MIKVFLSEQSFEDWLGSVTLPSGITIYLETEEEFVIHTNNKGIDSVYRGSFDDLKYSGYLTVEQLNEMEVFLNNLNPSPSSDLEERVETLETATESMSESITTLESTVGGVSEQVEGMDARVTALESTVGVIDETLATILGDE